MNSVEPKTPETPFFGRLKNPPKQVDISTSLRTDEPAHQWVELVYDFKGPLKKFGTFLYSIVTDVEQAGGVVTGVKIPVTSPLSPVEDGHGRYNQHGEWRCMFVKVSVRSASDVAEQCAAWEAAIRDIASRNK